MKKYIFTNGLSVIHFPVKGPTVSMHALVKVGAEHESPEVYGISHFIEHMLFEGTTNRSTLEIPRAIEGIGGEIGAYTTNERTCFYVKSLTRHFSKSLEVLGDILQNPLFANASLEKERGVILSEISMREDEPRYRQWDLLLSTLYKGYPAGHSVSGSRETVSRISREQMSDYFEKWYVPNNMILAVVGDIPDVPGQVKRYLSSKSPKKITPLRYSAARLKKKVTKKESRDITQSYMMLGYRTVPISNSDVYPLHVIRAILGKGMSGRLFDEIRNKRGLAYDIGAYHSAGVNNGFIVFYVSCAKKKLNTCQKIILDEIKNAHIVSPSELTDAKNFLEGEFILDNQDTAHLADTLSLFEYGSDARKIKNHISNIQKVTVADLARVSKKYLIPHYAKILIEEKKGKV